MEVCNYRFAPGEAVVSTGPADPVVPPGTPATTANGLFPFNTSGGPGNQQFTTVGETITYTFTVTNDGSLDIDLTGVDPTSIVSDDKIGAGGVDCADPDPLPAA